MDWSDLCAGVVAERSRLVVAVLLVATVAVGAGSVHVEESTSFQSVDSQSIVMQKDDYVQRNFAGSDNRTTEVLVVTRNESGNVLSKDALVRTLRYQQSLRENETIARTLTDDADNVTSVASVVAQAAVRQERRAELQNRSERLRERRQALTENASEFENETRRLQNRNDRLNRTVEQLAESLATARVVQYRLDRTEDERNRTRLRRQLASARANATERLNGSQAESFNRSFERVRSLQQEFDRLNASRANGSVSDAEYADRADRLRSQLRSAIRNGSRGVFAAEFDALQTRVEELRGQRSQLERRQERLQEDFAELENDTEAFRSSPPDPSLEEQRAQLESMSEDELEELISELFAEDTAHPLGQLGLQLLPKDYDPGTATADARMLVVTQQTQVETSSGASLTERTVDAQLAVRDLAEETGGDHVVFGQGFITTEESRSMTDSFTIIGPLALAFVLVTLVFAYRDVVDIVLGMFGVGVVLVWTFGFMGWIGIVFNQMMIAVPVLLIGLAIDYSIHVVMRYREERSDHSVRAAMRRAVGTVGVALALVTATTAVGFLTNLTSSLPDIQNFGIVSAAGIVSALVVFGGLVPALKIEVDRLLERVGTDRNQRAVGTSGGRLGSVLTLGARAAHRAPLVVLVAVLVVSSATAYAGTQVGSSFSEERFISDDPPEWTESLPEPFAPGEYTVKENLHYIHSNFQSPDKRVSILAEGDVTDPETLAALDDAEDAANRSNTTYVGPGGDPAVTSPLTLADRVARQNETVDELLWADDTDDDGVPDENVTAIYDALFDVAPDQAERVIYRTDGGEYESVRMTVSVVGTASPGEVASEANRVADRADREGLTVTATGGPVVDKELMEQVTSTVAESLGLTIVLVFVLLMTAFRLAGRRASLGALTVVPTLLSVSWILGTMYLLDIPFSFTTAVIGSVSIGLGIDYAIHVSERYSHELSECDDMWDALDRTVSGTGGALLSSAVTTASGFGVLVFTLLPGLRQFGLIIALSLVYAFVASVFVLPSLLALWTRAVGEDVLLVDDGPAQTAAND